MPTPQGKPKPIEAHMESSKREDQEQPDSNPVPQENEQVPEAAANAEIFQSDDWWSASPLAPDWSEPVTEAPTTDVIPTKEAGKADVYFCGNTSLFPLNRALQAIAKGKLTGLLRSFWDEEPIDLLARDGEIVLVTSRDPDFYCPETPATLTDADPVIVDRARNQQRETGTPFFLTLAREESIAREQAAELMQRYGQKLFSQLWTAPRARIMFERNADLLSDLADIPGEPNVSDWALETLRLVEDPDQSADFDPTSIPAYTKEGFEWVQKLKLTSDEAKFASQFNGARSVQQIARNLRFDLKSARQLLFRFLALEIVECWPASTAAKPEHQGFFQRLRGSGRRDR
ncbi:MAG TPA: DUF4388 domain-containing protein [Candidatus Udaeobacter sp.]|nr:DUF4388 domain-containing protein [Candidatus Udaeobacter sp.]